MSGYLGNSLVINGVQCPYQRAAIAAASNGVNVVVAAVSGKRIRCVALELSFSGSVNAKWQSHTVPTDLTGLTYGAAGVVYVLPLNELGWFESLVGESLDVNLSAGTAVGGILGYVTY